MEFQTISEYLKEQCKETLKDMDKIGAKNATKNIVHDRFAVMIMYFDNITQVEKIEEFYKEDV